MTHDSSDANSRRNFLTEIIDADLASGKHAEILTRFPPEPNGYLHIGHAKSICLNFGLAQRYQGRCNLRFDDTNPVAEDVEYVKSIIEDIAWLGYEWDGEPRFASDYFEQMYAWAIELIKAGKAYVDSSTLEEVRAARGSLSEAGKPTPYRSRSVEENLDLFARMKAGEFDNGAHILRAKIDLTSPNMQMRDPVIYRILRATHHRTGDAWCVYPMYDFAHCLEDAIEGVTHSICTLEFENNRELYDWILNNVSVPCKPVQYEFARLSLDYTMMSKRYLRKLVEEGTVDGWDDPRMPTVAGMRRRGVRPSAIRAFADLIGISKANSSIDADKFDYCVRDDLNHAAPRVMAVLDPLRVVITNLDDDKAELLDADYWPHDVPREGTRKLGFSNVLYIERSDFQETPEPKFRRLAPGREVRLRHAYFIKCNDVVKDESGQVIELRCTYDPATRGGAPDGRKVKGTIHWVSESHSVAAEVRLYDRLFLVPKPGNDRPAEEDLNPESLVKKAARLENSVVDDNEGNHYQFERHGYFCADSVDSAPDHLVFNRVVSLKSSWGKPKTTEPAAAKAAPKTAAAGERKRPSKKTRTQERVEARASSPVLTASYARFQSALGVSESDADLLTGDLGVANLFEAAVAEFDDVPQVVKWVKNDVLRALKNRPLTELQIDGERLGQLVRMVVAGDISASIGREVFGIMIESGDAAATIVKARGFDQKEDDDALAAIVAKVFADNPAEAARFRGGEKKLTGFFMGQVMRASQGKADAGTVRTLISRQLA